MILVIIALYFLLLLGVSRLAASRSNNDVFFRGSRQSPWPLVAFGMIGASISGVTFVSVPGMVLHSGMAYLYTCLGFVVGYFVVAYVLLPIYYRLNLTTIYSALQPLGNEAYKTGAAFFLLSKLTGAAARFYVPCYIIYRSIDSIGGVVWSHSVSQLLFPVTVAIMVALIWVYTRRGGIKTLVWTDTLQTLCMFSALILIIYKVSQALFPASGGFEAMAKAFSAVFTQDTVSLQPQGGSPVLLFLSGIFIVIVMTGLDQDMMQKNLTCRTLSAARKDMCTYGFAFLPANFLFLSLGVMLCMLCVTKAIPLPSNPDDLLTMFAATGVLGDMVLAFFAIGIVAAAFSSADSALTALTTCYCVDILGLSSRSDETSLAPERTRRRVHIAMAVAFTVCIMLFHAFNNTSLIDAIYRLCSYTYGPLLGLFAIALIHKKQSRPLARGAAFVCIAAPAVCYCLDYLVPILTGYRFGYELLMINGLLTYVGLRLLRR